MKRKFSKDQIVDMHKNVLRGDGALMKAAKGIPSWNADARTARFTMSSEVMDRDGDVIKIDGIDLTDFEKNPIALWAHSSAYPIGTWGDLSKVVGGRPKRLEGTLAFASEGTDDMADRIARLTGSGIVRACSIGFKIDWDAIEPMFDEGDNFTGFRFDKTLLLECSVCAIPANQAALAKSAGEDRSLALEIVSEVLDNWTKLPNGFIVHRSEYEDAIKTLGGSKTTVVVEKDTKKEPETAENAIEEEVKPSLIDRVKDAVLAALRMTAPDPGPQIIADAQTTLSEAEEKVAAKLTDAEKDALRARLSVVEEKAEKALVA
jgi:phage head maturation protease